MVIRFLLAIVVIASLFASSCCALGACDTIATDEATQLNIPN
jgi:hypothetical protein